MTDAETVLYCALWYAVHIDELSATEAVIREVRPKIPYLSDTALEKMRTEVLLYLWCGKDYADTETAKYYKFVPEWVDFLELLNAETKARAEFRTAGGDSG